jgi:hypothetical protein
MCSTQEIRVVNKENVEQEESAVKVSGYMDVSSLFLCTEVV